MKANLRSEEPKEEMIKIVVEQNLERLLESEKLDNGFLYYNFTKAYITVLFRP
jgi:hypothetical protein